ncbi:hypothetical protein PHAVU_005G081900 [Phaseolus vulgaris]|uniref:DOG1 domain-containing protein n=1 Tax=Phaseolus vulgaris TaxID=3885 RepID=V7BWZ9_PHAVU|nr:hypothetical protein PHAVU_005G081900g [Phaseolus vulgaris]ESW21570.1 hypothetical protein PHAVU_005G081900g [Phaseolus vulgaris]
MNTSFAKFYRRWFEQLQEMVQRLKDEHNEEVMDKVMRQHQDYYRAKWAAVEKDPLCVFLSPWTTTLERSLHWITGWRPTTAFHLIYTESSLLFESHIIDILHGLRTGDLGDLTPSQFRHVSDLQCDTVKEENAIQEELSEWQDSASEMGDPDMDMNEKIIQLVPIIKKADDLRLTTLRSVVRLLSTQQAIEFLIASGELLIGIRSWGMNQDSSTS